MKTSFVIVGLGVLAFGSMAVAQEVQVWDLPKGQAQLEARTGWQRAKAGPAGGGGAVAENQSLMVVARSGETAATVHIKGGNGVATWSPPRGS